MSIFPVRWAGAKRARRPARTAGSWAGSYDPFCTECTAFVDHPPDESGSPQVVRGEPHLGGTTGLPAEVTLDRLRDRRRLVDQFDEQFVRLVGDGGLGDLSQAPAPGVRDAHLAPKCAKRST